MVQPVQSSKFERPPHIPRLGSWWRQGYARIPLEKKKAFFAKLNSRTVDPVDTYLSFHYTILELADRFDATGNIDAELWSLLVYIVSKRCEQLDRQCRSFGLLSEIQPGIRFEVLETIGFYAGQAYATRSELLSWRALERYLSGVNNNDELRKRLLAVLVRD